MSRIPWARRPGRARLRSRAPCRALLAGIVLLGCGGEGLPRPDLVLITVGALRADQLACLGGPPDAGRSLCRLARGGTLFSWTLAPGRGPASSAASLLTGLPPALHGVDDRGLSFLPDAIETLPERLKRGGYATAAFVASPVLGRSRRLDQGFERYEDRVDTDVDLPTRVQRWAARAERPFFVWVHLPAGAGLSETDRLVARLDGLLESESGAPGVLFAALRGADVRKPGIGLASHRVALIWRPPEPLRPTAPRPVSDDLASLLDVSATLVASARLPGNDTAGSPATDLSGLRPPDPEAERFLLLEDAAPGGEVGIAAGRDLYVRLPSPLDGTGRPVPTEELDRYAPRFLTRPAGLPAGSAPATTPKGPWRDDALAADSPVPRLEFHLARLLRERAEAGGD